MLRNITALEKGGNFMDQPLKTITLTVKQAAELSQIGIKEIYWQIENNPKFPYFRIGRKTLIPRTLFENWVLSLARCGNCNGEGAP